MIRRRASSTRVALLAGWLFADLLAFMFVIALSTEQGRSVGAPTSSATPTPTGTATPTPTTSSPPHPPPPPSSSHTQGLDPHFLFVTVGVDFAKLTSEGPSGPVGQRVIDQVDAQLAKAAGGGRPVGFVVTFGLAPTVPNSNIDYATAVAELVDQSLFKRQPQFAHCQEQVGWKGGSEGTVTLKIFFDNP